MIRAITGMQNQVNRLERKQPIEAVFLGTYDEPVALPPNVEVSFNISTVLMNQGIYFKPVVNTLPEMRWICMSSGLYMIGFQLFFNVPVPTVTFRMMYSTISTAMPTATYTASIIQAPANLANGSMLAYLEEGWTFAFGITVSTNATLLVRQIGIDQNVSPILSIAQISREYDTPSTDNEWYYEDNLVAPR